MNTKQVPKTYSTEMIMQQLSDSSRVIIDLTASMVYDEPSLLNLLIEVAWMDRNPWSERASRVVCTCCCRFPELLKPFGAQIVQRLKKTRSEGVIRNFLKIMAEAPVKLTNKDKSVLLNLCFDFLTGNFAVSVKVFSMQILYNLSLEIPEIKRELYSIIEDQFPESSAGFKNRGGKILKKLTKSFLL
jgi:hypothetical protein